MSDTPQQQAVPSQTGPKAAKRKRCRQPKQTGQPDRPVFEPNAAGIDIGAREIYVAVPADRDPDPVRPCATFTGDLDRMAEWLRSCGITTAAMESTGVYWIPVYDVLEKHGIKRKRLSNSSVQALDLMVEWKGGRTNAVGESAAPEPG